MGRLVYTALSFHDALRMLIMLINLIVSAYSVVISSRQKREKSFVLSFFLIIVSYLITTLHHFYTFIFSHSKPETVLVSAYIALCVRAFLTSRDVHMLIFFQKYHAGFRVEGLEIR